VIFETQQKENIMPTLTVRYNQMSSNNNLPGGFSAILTPNQTIHLVAPDLAVSNPAPPPDFFQYHALFWNISGSGNGLTLGISADAHIQNEDVIATAWYYAVGGVGPTPPTGVRVFAFSESQNLFLAENPIDSVVATDYDPANPMWVPTGSGEVFITPKSSLSGERFSQWLISGAAVVQADNLLHENQGMTDWAIACYKAREWPLPEILELIERLMHDLPDPSDPATVDLYKLLEKMLGHKVPAEFRATDELSTLTERLTNMKDAELHSTLAALKAQGTRNTAAQKLVESEIRNR
jgi:hypothetical protein